MELKATGMAAPTRYFSTVCEECGKAFECSLDTRYRRRTEARNPDGTKTTKECFFCRWSCLNKWDERREREKLARREEKSRILSEKSKAQWEKWRAEHPKTDKPTSVRTRRPRSELDRQLQIQLARQKMRAYELIRQEAPPSSRMKKNAAKSVKNWGRRLKELEEWSEEDVQE